MTAGVRRVARAMRTAVVMALLVAGLGAVPAPTVRAADAPAPDATFDVTIRRTSHGIPHIEADDWSGLGFGYGLAFAEDNVCTMAETYVTVRAERALWFGPDGSYVFEGNGAVVNNLNSDFFFQQIIDARTVEALIDQTPPHGPRPEARELVRGYVAGYNHYLRTTGVANLPDPTCRGAEWVRPIDEIDAYRRYYQLALLASAGVAIDGIGGAQPPPPGGLTAAGHAVPAAPIDPGAAAGALAERWPLAIGSNAYGLGSEATQSGAGMVLGNPHFPWQGSERFYQSHLRIPGTLDVAGASLFGVPIVLIGHTERMAWSHTVSTAFRFTPFELKLVPGSPTTYLYDGQPRQMTSRDVTVTARNADGSLEPRTRTLWSSHHGPILTSILGLPIFPWTGERAYAMGDANAGNFRYLNHFLETDLAQSVDELHEVLVRNQGIPWVNTIAADADGRALYADISVVPHVTDEHADRCVSSPVGLAVLAAVGLPVLDGSQSSCEWGTDPDARQPGTFGPGNLPHLFRDDYVTNSNDSYWLSNPKQPLTGFESIIGDEETPRSLRTRSGLVMVEERLAGTDGREGVGFTLEQLQETVFANRQHAGELTRDALVAMCESFPGGLAPSSEGVIVDVSEACPVLATWDVRDDLDSRGAILFRRFWSHASGAAPDPWVVPFDPADPVHTPNTLDTGHPQVREALANAVQDLRSAGIPLDAPLRDWQSEARGDERIPIHGGPGGLGVFNAINVRWDPSAGYPDVRHGSSFVMAVELDDECPESRSILTYSQSANPDSPYYVDQTRLYVDKAWVDMRFCTDEILADPNLEERSLSVPDPQARASALLAAACPPDRVPEDGFTDVAPDNVHESAVDCVHWWEVAFGRGETYGPGEPTTRAQMASFVSRLLDKAGVDLPSSPPDAFPDDEGSVHEPAIDALADLGVVDGRPDGTYGPDEPVSRAQMASFLARAFEEANGAALPATELDWFADDDGSVHEPAIDRAAAAGITLGVGGGRYAPSMPVRRDQMASFLARLLGSLVDAGVATPPD